MKEWLAALAPWVTHLGANSLKAVPLILLLALLQRFAWRWITPRGMALLWYLAVIRLLMPDLVFTRVSAYVLPTGAVHWAGIVKTQANASVTRLVHTSASGLNVGELLTLIWLVGVLAMGGVLLAQTWRFHRRVVRLRPSTDEALLNLLEDVKEEAGVRTPISLVVSETIPAPALLGFLRPRLLLPVGLARSLKSDELRCIFQHEIAHVRGWDIALNWLVSVTVALHWFNPLAWIMAERMARAREIACDQAVLAQRGESRLYGEVILRVAETLRSPQPVAGMAGIVENKHAMHERIEMLSQKPGRFAGMMALVVGLALGSVFLTHPLQAADEKETAITASEKASDAWLPIMDAGKYAESYDAFCVMAKAMVTKEDWVKVSTNVRTPLGKVVTRTLKDTKYVAAAPNTTTPANVVLQYETDYENIKATETVTTMQDKDGRWRVAGYFIKPRS